MKSIIIQVYGSDSCEICKNQLTILKHYSLPHIYIDVNKEENQEICDLYNIDILPTLQVIAKDSGEILADYIGFIDPKILIENALQNLKDNKKFVIADKIKKEEECQSCKKKNQR